jgi:Tfp pilus assembly protein FimT
MLQMIITVAIIAIVSTFGFLGIVNARARMRVQNSARMFAAYAEKVRADSIRRHAAVGNEASIQSNSEGGNTFTVRMDFDGSGNLQTRTFTLDQDVTFNNSPKTATFDWRGRITDSVVFQVFNSSVNFGLPVDISGSGDVTIGDQIFGDQAIPDIALADVSPDIATDPTPNPTPSPTASPIPDPTPTPVPTATPPGNGNGNGTPPDNSPHNSPTPTPTPLPSATPTPSINPSPSPSPSPLPPICSSALSASSVVLSQSISSQRTKTVQFSLTNASGSHSINVAAAGSGSPLTLSVSPTTMTGDGTATVTIGAKSGAGNRGSFTVNISASPTCGTTRQVSVTVNN